MVLLRRDSEGRSQREGFRAAPVGRANAAERGASANGSGLSTGGFAADIFGWWSPPHRSPFAFGVNMKRFWPLILICVGVALVLGGFVYDVMFAGIPYQDPTPEISARYAHHAHVASVICSFGVALLLAGSVAGLVRFVIRRLRRPLVS